MNVWSICVSVLLQLLFGCRVTKVLFHNWYIFPFVVCLSSGGLHLCYMVILNTYKIQILFLNGFRSDNQSSFVLIFHFGCVCTSPRLPMERIYLGILFDFYTIKLLQICTVWLFREGIYMVLGSNILDWNMMTVLQKSPMQSTR